jgi:hypothetical protein
MAIARRWIKWTAVTAIAVAALVLNPVFGITSGFDYGAPELRAALEGTWRLTITTGITGTTGDAPRVITFTIAQASRADRMHAMRAMHASSGTWVRSAAACGGRTLVRTAGACMDYTDMPLEATVLTGAAPAHYLDGWSFTVGSTSFTRGQMRGQLDDLWLEAELSRQGQVLGVSATYRDEHVPRHPTATLVRLAP